MVTEEKELREGYKMTELGEVPVEWEINLLEEKVEILDGSRRPIKKEDRVKGDIPYYGATGIIDWVNDNIFEESLILVGEDGENLRSRVLPMAFKIEGKSWVNNHAHVLKPNDDVDIDYLTYYLESIDYDDYITGSAQPKLNQNQLRKIKVIFPKSKEQKKIAEILSTVDEQIENTDQLIAKTKELKKGLMQQLLTKGIGHMEFKQSELGEIPTNWEVIALEEVSKILRGASPRPKGDPRYYGGNIPRLMIADITRDGKFVTPQIDFLTEEGAKKSRPMPKGTFVVACSGTYVGYPSILNVDACIHDGIIAIVDFENSFDIEYLYYVFTRLYNELNSSATHGGVFNNLTTQIIKEFKIVKPLLEEQQEIAEILSTVDAEIESYEQEKEKYTELKKGLMQQLLTGKIRVTV